MPPTASFNASGTVFAFASVAAPTVFTDLEEVTDISVNGEKLGTDDATHMQSAAKEYIPTIPDGGTVDISFNYVPGAAGQIAFRTRFTNKEVCNFKITLPNALGSRSFAGIIIQPGDIKLPVEKKATVTAKVQVTGATTIA